jgi:pimeloyl-ACP methyl ester carboxylesterase
MRDDEFLTMQKSTSVRSQVGSDLAWLRPGVRVLGAVAPALAARLAERLLLTPVQHAAPPPERAALESARRQVVSVDGTPVTTWTWGHGPVVLLVHGWSGRGGQLASFVPALLERGFSVVTFDAPGHGASPADETSVVAFVAAVRAVAATHGPVRGIIAHSAGAMAAARAMFEGLAVEGAVFLAPASNLAAYSDAFMDALGFSRPVRERMRVRVETRLQTPWTALDLRALAPAMDAPLLVIHDRDDADVPWQDGAIVAQAWPGAALVTTGGLGHRRILRDGRVLRAAADFLGERIGARAHADLEVTLPAA